MNTRTGLACLAILCAAMSAALVAQDTRAQREELERLFATAPEQKGISKPNDEVPFSQRGEEFKPAPLGERRDWLWDVGGWGRASFSTFDTPFGRDSTLRDFDIRAWADVSYKENNRVYARVRSFYTDYNGGDGRDDWQNFRVDQLFYEGQIARMAGAGPETDFNVTLGRQFFFMGKGVALASVLEGARIYWRHKDWEAEAVAAQTIRYSPDLDPTLPLTRRESNRMFFGGTISTYALLNRKFYAYGLFQVDNNDLTGTLQNPAAAVSYAYDTTHLGIGSEGSLPLFGAKGNELGYSAEIVMQLGSSTANNSTTEESISAYGFLADVFWLPGKKFSVPTRFVFGYAFGSGDPDRQNQTGTAAGNTAGTDDSAFNYFGFVNTGYSLGAKLTNLHMLKANAEATFFKDSKGWTRELKVGAAGYAFFKHHSGEVISDFTAIRPNRWIGHEWNLYADWKLTTDLDVGLRYGAFVPGDAYSVSKTRQYLSVYFQLSF